MRNLKIKTLITSLLLISYQQPTFAAQVTNDKIETCKNEPEKVNRLACFDKLFSTPIERTSKQDVSTQDDIMSPTGSIELLSLELDELHRAEISAKLRDAEQSEENSNPENWIMRFSRSSDTRLLTHEEYDILNSERLAAQTGKNDTSDDFINVFLSTSEILPADKNESSKRSKLLLSCENDITTIHLILDESIQTHTKTIKFENNLSGKQDLIWQDIENGRVLIMGHGLNSIQFIKNLAASRRAQFTYEVNNKQHVIIFNVSNLENYLPPIRSQCHWQ